MRDSSPELSRALRLPGIDEPAPRFARGTQPPVEGGPLAADLAPEPAPPVAAPRGRAGLAVAATLVSAGVLGLIAALLQSAL